ncbi:hypothetical protein A5787_06115 [Mycobacterium sp. 852002-50816_SCH5313054-b]|uniref:WXG100 family type VII secretion target n=1 Tax=Mycobacterium sp. 852002-50816_SCH5313054-b TaxID=1834092 RepID=UPI0007FDFF27|nr:hypothetical protein [Mycobacterium sp. 852002-50816_SCH5313054-b]OBF53199.1 hypothetical protein A5787_06115 [Mycobacterium sp. 852002-50816_SCH5313054-b]
MGPLTPNDVKRWDLGAIQQVFETANGRASTLQRLGDNLQQVHNVLGGWDGEAGEAFRADLGKARRDIEADGQESRQVAAAVSRAEADVRACKNELADIERAADAKGWKITPDWRIDVGDTWVGRDTLEFAAQQQVLQDRLILLKAHADSADHELAAAIRAAVSEAPLDAGGRPPAGGPPPQQGRPKPPGARHPRSLEDMLLPDGPAEPGAGKGPPSDAPAPATGTTGKPPSLQDLLLPSDKQPAAGQGDQPQPGSLPDLLSRLHQPVVPGPPPQLKPADVESFKAMARPSMIRDGVPPEQIEARLNDIVGRTQQWIDNGMPNYVPPEPKAPPPPGFGEGFADRWFATEQGIHNLLGVGGPGAPGVLESWQQMLKGTVETAVNPFGTAMGEVKNALDSPSPAYYLGGKASDGAFALPGLLFGGEGAGIGRLADIDAAAAVDYGPTHLPQVPVGLDHPIPYQPFADLVGQDLYSSFVHGEPTTGLSQQFADMSTHYVGDNPDRVVLGRWAGHDDGYIGEARSNGGIYYDTGGQPWDALTGGLNELDKQILGWQPNEAFLRQQMENHVPRIEYVLPDGFNSVDEVARVRRETFSAFEINFLDQNGAKFGYTRIGNAWVYEGG